MKNKLFILFVFLLILSCTFGETKAEKQTSSPEGIAGDVVYLDIGKFQIQNEGELPLSQLLLPIFQNTSNLFPSSEKTKKIVRNLVRTRLKCTYDRLLSIASVFSWHSSVFIHVFLKTTCFRI